MCANVYDKGQMGSRGPYKDVRGQRYGMLTILEVYDKRGHHYRYKCKCDCGNESIAFLDSLQSGHTTSCGCHGKASMTTHGLSKHPIYKTWIGMRERCLRENGSGYYRYGARGIKVCDEWVNDFQKFYDWAMENGWKEGLTLDRIDNDGDYCPDNCRWADRVVQSNNRSSNKYLTYNDKTMSVSEWAYEVGMPVPTLFTRLRKGWSVERALTEPVHPRTEKTRVRREYVRKNQD